MTAGGGWAVASMETCTSEALTYTFTLAADVMHCGGLRCIRSGTLHVYALTFIDCMHLSSVVCYCMLGCIE